MEKVTIKPSVWASAGFIKRMRYSLTIYPSKLVFRSGILARSETEINISDIRAVSVEQSIFERFIGVGTLSIATAGTSLPEITIPSIPDPKKTKTLILASK
ncbi:PH domain-containing protein, partial [Candidatus Bipolaricaulota bacterium]|nr:PH domain-containing protein [Candidatus Bipolaricaulota bacterium]